MTAASLAASSAVRALMAIVDETLPNAAAATDCDAVARGHVVSQPVPRAGSTLPRSSAG